MRLYHQPYSVILPRAIITIIPQLGAAYNIADVFKQSENYDEVTYLMGKKVILKLKPFMRDLEFQQSIPFSIKCCHSNGKYRSNSSRSSRYWSN